jgi:hypothetical protein
MVYTASSPTLPLVDAPPRRPGHPLLVIFVIAALQVVLVLTFAWAASRATPHRVPIAVTGPAAQTQSFIDDVRAAHPGAFAVTTSWDEAGARSAVTSRQAYAAVVLTPDGATVYTASGAAPSVATQLAAMLPAVITAGKPGAAVVVTDLAPNPRQDPHGAALPAGLIPITITSIVAGAAAGLMSRTRRTRVAAVILYAVIAGALSAVALQTLLGGLTGHLERNAGVLALACLAVSAATAALASLLKQYGAALSALVVFFFGFPFSGVSSAWQFAPQPYGQIAQYLPVGAANEALRSVAFFAGAAARPPLLVLGAWAGVGLLLCLFRGDPTGTRQRRPRPWMIEQ